MNSPTDNDNTLDYVMIYGIGEAHCGAKVGYD